MSALMQRRRARGSGLVLKTDQASVCSDDPTSPAFTDPTSPLSSGTAVCEIPSPYWSAAFDVHGGFSPVTSPVAKGFSEVRRATRREDGQQAMLKIVKHTMLHELQSLPNMARAEFELLRTLEHPGILHALGMWSSPAETVLALEFFEGRSLLEVATRPPAPTGAGSPVPSESPPRLLEATYSALSAVLTDTVWYLHRRGIVHRNIKPTTVLVNHDLSQIRLVDFYMACDRTDGFRPTASSSMRYAAPEVLLGGLACECSDVWATGLCIHLLIAGFLPQGRSEACLSAKMLEELATQRVLLRGELWEGVHGSCKEVLEKCLAVEKDDRPTMEEVRGGPWLKDIEVVEAA